MDDEGSCDFANGVEKVTILLSSDGWRFLIGETNIMDRAGYGNSELLFS